MKKLFILGIALFFANLTNAQEIADHAIGLRFGNNNGMGAEISYQKGLSDNNRVEIDLGWRTSNNLDAFKLTGLYQWVWEIESNFNWFVGAGGGISSWSDDKSNKSGTGIFAAGDIGIEYNFKFPLLLSIDVRPELGFGNSYSNDLDMDFALSARYTF